MIFKTCVSERSSADIMYFLSVGKVEKKNTSGQQPKYNTSFAKI